MYNWVCSHFFFQVCSHRTLQFRWIDCDFQIFGKLNAIFIINKWNEELTIQASIHNIHNTFDWPISKRELNSTKLEFLFKNKIHKMKFDILKNNSWLKCSLDSDVSQKICMAKSEKCICGHWAYLHSISSALKHVSIHNIPLNIGHVSYFGLKIGFILVEHLVQIERERMYSKVKC